MITAEEAIKIFSQNSVNMWDRLGVDDMIREACKNRQRQIRIENLGYYECERLMQQAEDEGKYKVSQYIDTVSENFDVVIKW